VVSATPGSQNPTVAATLTIDSSTLGKVNVSSQTGSANTVQTIAVNANGGTFTLSYGGGTSAALPFDAPAVRIENAIKSLPGINDVKVSQNGTEYLVTFLDPSTGIVPLTANGAGLKPGVPGDLVGYTVEITKGPAKNKVRIITAAQAGNGGWVLTLDKPWLSLFTGDASVPDATSKFTLATTNPNLLVKEETLANLLYLYDTDNPASYN